MRNLIKTLLLLTTFSSFGQTVIKNVSLDTLGRLKWDITYMTPDLEIEIQRFRSGHWTTINRTGHHVEYFEQVDAINTPHKPEPLNITDSCIVPLDRGVNKYRIVMTVPAKINSIEVSANLFSNNNKHQLFSEKDNYIRFNKGVFFWINDSTGKQVWKPDSGRMINTTKLKSGLYYIVVYPDIYEFHKKQTATNSALEQ